MDKVYTFLFVWMLLGVFALLLVNYTYRGREKLADITAAILRLSLLKLLFYLVVIYFFLPFSIYYSIKNIIHHKDL